jgi:hypothetical protein
MAATQPMPMPPITPSGGGGAGNWFSTHKGLAIGGGIVGLLALYYLYTKMKSSSSGSSSGANVGSGSGTVQILTGTPASQSGTQSGMGEQAYYAQLQALQSGIDTQLQNQIASSGTGYGSTGTGNGSSTGTSTGTSTSQPVVSTSTPTWSSQPMQTTTPVVSTSTPVYVAPTQTTTQATPTYYHLPSLNGLAAGTTIYGRRGSSYIPEGTYSGQGSYVIGLPSASTRSAEGIGTGLYSLN